MRTASLLLLLLLGACSSREQPDSPGPFEKAGKNFDAAVAQVGEKSEELADKTVTGARRVTKKVADSVGQAANWVSRSVSSDSEAQDEVSPTPSPMPPQ